MKNETSRSNKPFKCGYCNTGFTREKTLFSHTCEQKRRHLQKDDKHVRLAFYAFLRFYKLNVGSTTKEKSYDEFCRSQYYKAFVKFGSYVSNVKPLYPEKYIDYVVTSGAKLDHWCRDELYEKYALEYILKEDATVALTRSIETMDAWAKENNSVYNHYFLYASANRIVRDIRDGKVSPWLMLNCKSGKDALNNFNDEQLSNVFDVINPKKWIIRFSREKDDVALIKDIAKKANL
jgi:hypothetical protein